MAKTDETRLDQTTVSTDKTTNTASQQSDMPVLRLDDVSYSYTKGGKRVLKNISHDFQSGSVHAITGPSGAGKTTMLSLISGLANPTEGKVLYNSNDLSKQDRYRYRSHDIGVIFQGFNLLPNLTVAENIILSMDASGKTFDRSKKEIVNDLLYKCICRRNMRTNAFCIFPEVSSSVWRSPARSATTQPSSWRTNRPAISTSPRRTTSWASFKPWHMTNSIASSS